MCGPLSGLPGFKETAKLAPGHMQITRAIDKKLYGYNDQTTDLGGGGYRSNGRQDAAALYQAFNRNRLGMR